MIIGEVFWGEDEVLALMRQNAELVQQKEELLRYVVFAHCGWASWLAIAVIATLRDTGFKESRDRIDDIGTWIVVTDTTSIHVTDAPKPIRKPNLLAIEPKPSMVNGSRR